MSSALTALRAVFVTLALWLGCSTPALALELVLNDASLNENERRTTLELLAQVQRKLPPSLVEELDRSVEVGWSRRLPPEVMGRAGASGRIWLNRRWLGPLVSAEQVAVFAARGHGSLRQELLAAVIHELVHLYDRAIVGPAIGSPSLRCRRQFESNGLVGLPVACRGNHQRQRRLSDDPLLLDLAGWSERSGGRGQRRRSTDQPDRSPDDYEQASPAEFVAVNLEYFLLDPQYACRRPALHQYFSQQFRWAPAHQPCSPAYPFVRAGLRSEDPTGMIDPSRVYAVHYLLAEPNRDWASRWGHSMLRLVICAPGRTPGPDCLLDLEHHLVLSFRAFVDDLQLSSWDGLTGAYPSRLFIVPLSQVVDEYTRLELRGLQSIPLLLTESQRTGLVRQAAQLHWSYDGRYYFVSNNCAVETLKLLRVGTADSRLAGMETVTPTGLLRLLEHRGMADDGVLSDRSAAIREGFYFDSHRARYERMLAVVRDELGTRADSVEAWLERPAALRRDDIGRAGRRAAAALLLLEQAAHDRQMLLAQHELKQLYLARPGEAWTAAGNLLEQLLYDSAFLSRPAALSAAGYGLPQPAEWAPMQEQVRSQHATLKRRAESFEKMLPGLIGSDRKSELRDGERNLELIAKRIKMLHKSSGGLLLP